MCFLPLPHRYAIYSYSLLLPELNWEEMKENCESNGRARPSLHPAQSILPFTTNMYPIILKTQPPHDLPSTHLPTPVAALETLSCQCLSVSSPTLLPFSTGLLESRTNVAPPGCTQGGAIHFPLYLVQAPTYIYQVSRSPSMLQGIITLSQLERQCQFSFVSLKIFVQRRHETPTFHLA